MEYPLQQLLQVIADFMLPFTRVSAMMFIMVAFGAKNIPTRVKAAFCAAFIVMIMPVVPPVKDVNLMSLNLVVQMIQQILIGLAIGFISQIFVQAFVTAGQILATQTGLGFAAMADPANGVSVPAIGQFYLILATLLFLVYDGHLIMFQMVVFSFESLPIDGQWMDVNKYWQVAEFGGWIIVTALAITLAPVTAMLVVNIAFGVLTRTAPQLNIFSLGMPISMLAGLLIMWMTMDTFLFHFNLNWQHGIEYTCKLIGC